MNNGLFTTPSSPRRRLIVRTESTELRRNMMKTMSYALKGDFFRTNTLGSQYGRQSPNHQRSRQRLRSSSTKSLFTKTKSTQKLNRQTRINDFVPSLKDRQTNQLIDGKLEAKLQQILSQKLQKRELKLHKQPVDYTGVRKIVNQMNKTFSSTKDELVSNILETRKQNLSKVYDSDKFNKLVSDYSQTQPTNDGPENKYWRMSKTNAYSVEVSGIVVAGQGKKMVQKYQESSSKAQLVEYVSKNEAKSRGEDNRHEEWKNVVAEVKDKLEQPASRKRQKIAPLPKQPDQKAEQKVKQQKMENVDSIDFEQIQLVQLEAKPITPETKLKPEPPKTKQSEVKVLKTRNQPPAAKKAPEVSPRDPYHQLLEQIQQMGKFMETVQIIGLVAPSCSISLKKISSLNWLQPAILMYVYCKYNFKQKQMLQERAYANQVIKKEQLQQIKNLNEQMANNLNKMLTLSKKKQQLKLKQQTYQLALEPDINVLPTHIQQNVIDFVQVVLKSEERENLNLLNCTYQMINAVKVLASLKGIRINFLSNLEEIEKLDSMELSNKIKNQFEQISLSKFRL